LEEGKHGKGKGFEVKERVGSSISHQGVVSKNQGVLYVEGFAGGLKCDVCVGLSGWSSV